MTKQSKSGGASVEVKSRKSEQFQVVDKNDTWQGQEVEVRSDLETDHNTGKPIILRFFSFTVNPIEFQKAHPTNQQIFNNHAQQIRLFLWRDGLDVVTAIEPKVIRTKDGYNIAVTCQPKAGVSLLDKTQSLQEILTY